MTTTTAGAAVSQSDALAQVAAILAEAGLTPADVAAADTGAVNVAGYVATFLPTVSPGSQRAYASLPAHVRRPFRATVPGQHHHHRTERLPARRCKPMRWPAEGTGAPPAAGAARWKAPSPGCARCTTEESMTVWSPRTRRWRCANRRVPDAPATR